jgi:hypothetical protein
MGYVDGRRQQDGVPGLPPVVLEEIGRRAQEQRSPIAASERGGLAAKPLRGPDLVDDLAARRDPDAPPADLVGTPDMTLGVLGAPVRADGDLGQQRLEKG